MVPVEEQPKDALVLVIERAISSPDFDVAKLQQLLELKERYDRNEARKAFVVAMNAFKVDPPEIVKNKHVKAGQMEYDHATLDNVCKAVTKGLSEHGISHRWKIEQTDPWIKVTCILTHDMGHSEETTLQGAADTTGAKNAIQAVGSTVTYLQRYTLLAATGLAAANTDTDGKVAVIPLDKVAANLQRIMDTKTGEELKEVFKEVYLEAETSKDKAAMSSYIKAKADRIAQAKQADGQAPQTTPDASKGTVEHNWAKLHASAKERNIGHEEIASYYRKRFKVEHGRELTKAQFKQVEEEVATWRGPEITV